MRRQNPVATLPEQWRAAYERDRQGTPSGNDPGPERKAGRVLAAFILTGLVFLALPGTFLGVWNLLVISSKHASTGASTAWIQSHGQAQLFGWVGTFILGISLYVLPKFLGRMPRRFGAMWLVWLLWTLGVLWRWWSGVYGTGWRVGLPGSALLEVIAYGLAQYILWFDRSDRPANHAQTAAQKAFPGDLASWLGVAGCAAFGLDLALNLIICFALARGGAAPVYPPASDRMFLILALWGFVIPVAWGYSTRFVTVFAGLAMPAQSAARWLAAGVAAVALCALGRWFVAADILALGLTLAAVWALRVFLPSEREPKRSGVYARFPLFIRVAYAWLVAGAALGVWADFAPQITGLGGASRHSLTVGFIATLIFCVAPLILPSFMNGRQLFSPRIMALSLWLLTLGCLARVSSEAVTYSQGGIGWKILPLSAFTELTAVFLFVLNLALTLAQPMPAWFSPAGVSPRMPLYFYVTSFPKTRRLLIASGLATLGRIRKVPRTLTLGAAAEADGANLEKLLCALREFFALRQPRR